jgi:hypothetical protein
MSEHIAAEVLAAYVDGELENGQKPGVEAHLSRCQECRAELAAVREIQQSQKKIPAEFLRLALGERRRPVRAVMPARRVFGIAAVFLVVVLIGYFFLGRGRLETAKIAGKELPQQADAAKNSLPMARDDGKGGTRIETAERASSRREARVEEIHSLKMEKKFAAGEAKPGQPAALPTEKMAAPAALPNEEERRLLADEEDQARSGEEKGGILGGVEAPLAKDKENAMERAAAPVPPGVNSGELLKNKYEIPGKAATPVRSQGAMTAGGMPPRSRYSASGAPGDAMQLFLAATGRAAAARVPHEAVRPSPWPMRVEGDVAPTDLMDPGLLDNWDWFPEEKAMELTIDAAGAVRAVTLLGQWGGLEAARASEAAGKLTFRPSAKETRRAVLSRTPLN